MAKITGNEPINSFSYKEREPSFSGAPISTIVDKVSPGLTIRQYYAGLAMQGLMAHIGESSYMELADTAIQFADALIAELNKSEQ